MKEDTSELRGDVFDIKRFAIHDGNGIRTTVFLKGCPLSCIWCQNPEGIARKPDLWFYHERCIQCSRCVEVCSNNALSAHPDDVNFIHIDRHACTNAGTCVAACPVSALDWDSKNYSVSELVDVIRRDESFYRRSGGGVTLSGGEPFVQNHFTLAVLKACREEGIHTAVETTASYSHDIVREALPYIDQFLVDIKLWNSDEHLRYTGVRNEQILKNISYIAEQESDLLIRIPMIPEITTPRTNLEPIARFVAALPGDREIELVNFNPLPRGKYHALGQSWKFSEYRSPYSEEEMDGFKKIIQDAGARIFTG